MWGRNEIANRQVGLVVHVFPTKYNGMSYADENMVRRLVPIWARARPPAVSVGTSVPPHQSDPGVELKNEVGRSIFLPYTAGLVINSSR